MVHFAMFGGHERQLTTGRSIHITVFGGLQVARPPVARCTADSPGQGGRLRDGPQHFFVTLFAAADIRWPTLVEEYLALRDAVRAATLTLEEWDRLVAQPGGPGALRVASFTFFGGFDSEVLPSEDKELDDLAVQRHLGQITQGAADLLMLGIGQKGVQRLAAVRQAIVATLSAPN